MPRLQSAEGLEPKGLYKAIPSAGRGIYALVLIEPPEHVPEAPSEYVIKIDAGLCRRLRARSKAGETLRQQVERLLSNSLLSNSL